MQILSRIKLLKKVKENLANKIYQTGEEIKKDLDDIIDSFWINDRPLKNEDLYKIDLKDFSLFHKYLIEKVTEVHKDEICAKNAKELKESTCFKRIIGKINDAKSAYKIYMFNQPGDYIFIGDLHSDDRSLKRALHFTEFYEKVVSNPRIRLVFTGDYVDRGHVHLKLMERILMLKYLFPDQIFLLRGNHDGGILNDDGTLTLPYRIPETDCEDMYFPNYLKTLSFMNKSFNPTLLKSYLDFFNTLSYIAAIKTRDQVVLAVHGGVPRPKYENNKFYDYLNVIADLTDESKVDHMGINICQNIMWSDPYRGDGNLREDLGRFCFTKEHFKEFKNRFGIDLMIRGHECAEDGFRKHFNDCVITVFSSGGIHESFDEFDNEKGLNLESAYADTSPKVLSMNYDGVLTFI